MMRDRRGIEHEKLEKGALKGKIFGMKIPHVFIIAEAGVNHNGSVSLAKRLIDEAQKAGADAVKFQTFRTEDVVTANAPVAAYQKKNVSQLASQLEMLKSVELDEKTHRELFEHCQKKRIGFLSTPFDPKSLAFLLRLGVKKIKIPSGEITNGPLLLAGARTGLPIILSTGMSNLREIEQALGVIAFGYTSSFSATPKSAVFRSAFKSMKGRRALKRKVVLLQCTSAYPVPMKDINLLVMNTLRKRFGLNVGFSDHSLGITAAIAAVARGAVMIEKHFTLDKTMSGPDHQASLEPHELKSMVAAIRDVEKAMGDGKKCAMKSESKNIPVGRKSLVASRLIKKGQKFTALNLMAKRTGEGLSPMRFWDILGKTAAHDYAKDEKVLA